MKIYLKKILCLLSTLLLIFCLSSCGKKKQPEDDDEIILEPIPSSPAYSGKDLKDSPFVGSFSCSWSALDHSSTDDDSWHGRISVLEIKEDGTFSLRFDSLSGGADIVMTSVSGTVSVRDDRAECVIKGRDSEDFLGSDVSSFSLVLIDTDELRFSGEQIGAVLNRDVFTRAQ
ncbi:MAG: hypothetical protein IKZ63_06585 [Oscillospiraceae bacterium]|nr:hypothetical protein [Oscillospiraceae bacterium]